jgi:hypothetical protein
VPGSGWAQSTAGTLSRYSEPVRRFNDMTDKDTDLYAVLGPIASLNEFCQEDPGR